MPTLELLEMWWWYMLNCFVSDDTLNFCSGGQERIARPSLLSQLTRWRCRLVVNPLDDCTARANS
eukprot:2647870-Amphidinium_carterae.1